MSNPVVSFTHDAAGNTLTGSTVAVAYSGSYLLENRLGSISAGGLTSSYSYNNNGQRVRKFNSSGAGSTIIFVYDPSGHLLGEYDSTGAALREYVWLGDEPVAMFTPNGANPPSIFYIHNDHIDTPRVVLDRSGNLRWRWMAEPFGTTAPETNPQGLGAFTFNLRMPGQYFDAETGLVYNWHRDLDQGLGRYIQSDPIGLAGGINTYSYVDGNPISFTDPMGLQRCPGGMRPQATDQPGVWSCVSDPSAPVVPRCVTAECAAGLPPAPSERRSIEEIDRSLCTTVCGALWPGALLPVTRAQLLPWVGSQTSSYFGCKVICKDKSPEGQCPVQAPTPPMWGPGVMPFPSR